MPIEMAGRKGVYSLGCLRGKTPSGCHPKLEHVELASEQRQKWNVLCQQMATLTLPSPLRTLFSFFPLHTYPPILPPTIYVLKAPTLWVIPPRSPHTSPLSSDVECLKWQAYLALRGLKHIAVRWDISPDGALDQQLPNLQIPPPADAIANLKGELLAAHQIPAWVDERVGSAVDLLEGYKDEAARDESRAWVALLEGNVHAALVRDTQLSPTLSDPFNALRTGLFPVKTLLLHVLHIFRAQPYATRRSPADPSPSSALRLQLSSPASWNACLRIDN